MRVGAYDQEEVDDYEIEDEEEGQLQTSDGECPEEEESESESEDIADNWWNQPEDSSD